MAAGVVCRTETRRTEAPSARPRSATADQPVATDAETVSDAGLATPPQDTLAMGESVPNTSPTLSAAAPGSTSNASAPPQGGWIAVPPTGELFTNASATGPLASYTGSDVGTYSAAPPDRRHPYVAVANSWTGTPASAPYSDSQNAIQVQAADVQLQAGQASPAAGSSDSTDVTYDGVVYHFTGQGAVNGQIFNTYVDDTGTEAVRFGGWHCSSSAGRCRTARLEFYRGAGFLHASARHDGRPRGSDPGNGDEVRPV